MYVLVAESLLKIVNVLAMVAGNYLKNVLVWQSGFDFSKNEFFTIFVQKLDLTGLSTRTINSILTNRYVMMIGENYL